MQRIVLGLLLLATLVAATEWDINPGVAKLAKDGGHESLTSLALEALSEEDRKLLNADQLKEGVRFNDMPSNDEKSRIGVVNFGVKFKFTTKTAVARSHEGCKQHWHAMAPVSYVRVKPDGDNEKEDDDRDYIVFTNNDVKGLVVSQAGDWWNAATSKKGFSDPKIGDFNLAHILHMVQDSYSPSHALREGVGKDSCGKVLLYQGYTVQAGNGAHGKADHNPKEGSVNYARRVVLRKCAVEASKRVLQLYVDCKKAHNKVFDAEKMKSQSEMSNQERRNAVDSSTAYTDLRPCSWDATVAPALREIFEVTDDQRFEQAGGSVAMYSGSWDEKKEKMAEQIEALGNINVRTVEVNLGDQPDFAECSGKGEKEKTCKVEVHEPIFAMNENGDQYNEQLKEDEDAKGFFKKMWEKVSRKTKKVALPRGIPFISHRDRQSGGQRIFRFIVDFCDGQLTAAEETYNDKWKTKQNRISTLKNLVKSTAAIKKETRDMSALKNTNTEEYNKKKEERQSEVQKASDYLQERNTKSKKGFDENRVRQMKDK